MKTFESISLLSNLKNRSFEVAAMSLPIGFLNVPNAFCFVAVFVFLSARRFVRSVAAFYLVGVLLGLSLSVLFFGFLLQRIIPLPSVAKLPLFFGGWPLSFYVYYLLWTNFELILRQYKFYAIIYLCFFALLSLAVCYRVGPPSDLRTLNLLVWLLRLSSLSALYFFSLNRFRAIVSVIFLLIFSIWCNYRREIRSFAIITQNKISTFIYGPQPREFLTESEYREEARIYTQLELDKLRQHIQSRQVCDTLRLIYQLHTPNRTSSFIAGNAEHISPEERRSHCELFGFSEAQRNGDDETDEITDEYENDEYITDDDE